MPIRSLRLSLPATLGSISLALLGYGFAAPAHAQPTPVPDLHRWVKESTVIIAGEVLEVRALGTKETGTTTSRKMAASIQVDGAFKGQVKAPVISVEYQEILLEGKQGNRANTVFPNSYNLSLHQYGLLFLTSLQGNIYMFADPYMGGVIRTTRRKIPLANSAHTVEGKIETELYASLSDPDQAVAQNARQLLAVLGLPAHAQSQPFKAQITLTQSTVSNNQVFNVMTSVQNTSTTEQFLDVWACSYSDQWIPDSPLIHVDPENCLMNTHGKIRLGPGKSYRRTIRIHASLTSDTDHPASVNFRLGFVQAAQVKGVSPVSGSSPIWSIPLTITVTRNPAHRSGSNN